MCLTICILRGNFSTLEQQSICWISSSIKTCVLYINDTSSNVSCLKSGLWKRKLKHTQNYQTDHYWSTSMAVELGIWWLTHHTGCDSGVILTLALCWECSVWRYIVCYFERNVNKTGFYNFVFDLYVVWLLVFWGKMY